MVRVRYMEGFCRLYGIEFHPLIWTEVNNTVRVKVQNSSAWEVEGAEPVVEEVVEEAIEETVEEVVDVSIDLSSLSKSELKALCDDQGLEYKSMSTKAILIELLQTDDEE